MSSAPTTSNMTSGGTLDRAFAACREITRANARNFYYGLRLTPEPKRSAVYAIYAWMRLADDETDAAGAVEAKQRRLRAFIDRSERVFSGLAPDPEAGNPEVWVAFAHTIAAYPVDRDDLRQLLIGLERDLQHESAAKGAEPTSMCQTREDLERYCYCVASVVGLICIDIWGLRDANNSARREEARKLAVQRGLAFQLTNILRDYGQDFVAGRVYLPQEDFDRFGLTPTTLRAWQNDAKSRQMIDSLCNWARSCYQASAGLEEMIDPGCSPTLWTMTRIYSRLLEKVEASPERVCAGKRIRVRSIHKAGIVLRAVMKARTRAWA